MRQRLGGIVVSLVLAGLWLTAAWLGVASAAGRAGTLAGRARHHSFEAITPDPGWLALVRDRHAGSAGPEASGPTLNLNLTDGTVAGYVPGPGSVVITVTRPGQTPRVATTLPALDPGGFFYAAAVPFAGWWQAELLPGDAVWVAQGAASLSLTVPVLTALAEPEIDRVFGQAPASALLELYLLPHDDTQGVYTATTTTAGDGGYAFTWSPGNDLRRRDSGYAVFAADASRQAYRRYVAPYLQAHFDLYQLSGWAAPNTLITVTAHLAGQAPITSYQPTDSQGYFDLAETWYDPTWPYPPPTRLQPGDQLVVEAAGQTISTTVLPVTATVVPGLAEVRVQSLPGLTVEVRHYSGPPPYPSSFDDPAPAAVVAGTTNGSGLFTTAVPLAQGDYGAAVVTGMDGHATTAWYALPYVWLRLGANDLYGGLTAWGQVSAPLAPLTLTVAGPSGYNKIQQALYSNDQGRFLSNSAKSDAYYALESGDTVTVTSPGVDEIGVSVPALSAAASTETNVVSGTAPAHATVRVTLYHPTATITEIYRLTVTADAQGVYAADFGPLTEIGPYDGGEVEYRTPAGHTVIRPYSVRDSCIPDLWAQVGANRVNVAYESFCQPALLQVTAPGGGVKAQHTIYPGMYGELALFDPAYGPIIMMPGDRLEVFGADPLGGLGLDIRLVVPELTIDPQAASDTLSGQAPPGALLTLQVMPGAERFEYLPPFTATAGLDGHYSAPIPGGFDLLPGDVARAEVAAGSTRFYVLGAVPAVRFNLYDMQFSGVVDPMQAYTLSVTPPASATITFSSTAPADGTIGFGTSPATLAPGSAIGFDTADWHVAGTLAALTAHIEAATARITGTAPANSRLLVTAFDDPAGPVALWATATAAGQYSVTFASLAPLSGAARGAVTHYGADGLHTRLAWSQPHWQVTLGGACVGGSLGAAEPATVTLRRGAEVLAPVSLYVEPNGGLHACFGRPVASGDVLSAVQLGQTRAFTVPVLTASHDWARRALEGQAPPGAQVTVEFAVSGVGSGTVARSTVAGAGGAYGLDTSDLRLTSGLQHTVTLHDGEGNSVRLSFAIARATLYFPMVGVEATQPGGRAGVAAP